MALQQNKKRDLQNYLLLAFFLIIAYLPLSSFLFSLKNDALTDNFPNKYFFSAALQSGHLPLWNPYINFGLPLYADPGFAFWHPLTWLFGFIGYNVYLLTIEVLLYIWLAGVFMYELGKYLKHHLSVCFLMAIMYMCCGFFIGNLQHINFLTCAAFLPVAVKTFLQLQEKFTYRRLLYCALALYFLTVGGHPAIPFAAVYYLIAVFLGLIFFKDDKKQRGNVSSIIKVNLLLIISFVVLIVPLLYSYHEIFPYFDRSNPVRQSQSLHVGFSIPSYISFLFPFATTASSNFFGNDGLMRNGYFSFIGFAFFLVSVFGRKNKYQLIFLFSGLFMLLLSLGGVFKETVYPHLPLLKYIRTNGEYRVFSIFSFIITGSFSMNKLAGNGKNDALNKILFIFLSICLVVIVWVFLHLSETVLFTGGFSSQLALTDKMKWCLDNFTLYDRLLINAIVLAILLLIYFARKKRFSQHLISGIIAADLIIFVWMHLPVTGVQKRSVASIQHYFSGIQPGIPIPRLIPLKDNIRPGEYLSKIIGCWSYYSKEPGTPEYCDYPTIFTHTLNYFHSGLPISINQRPFVFLKNQAPDSSSLTIRKFTPEDILIETNNHSNDTLVLLQNDYPKWEVLVNGQAVKKQKTFISFISIPLQAGNNHIGFYFRNRALLLSFLISLMGLLILIFLMIYQQKIFFKESKKQIVSGSYG